MGARTPQNVIDKIIEKLLNWAEKGPGIYIASHVYKEYKKPKSYLYDLGKTHPEVKEALDLARELIASRISYHCFEGDKNSSFGEKILPMYCKDYKELLKWKAEIQKEQPSKDHAVGAFKAWLDSQKG